MKTRWKTVSGYENYLVSDDGRAMGPGRGGSPDVLIKIPVRELKISWSPKGYAKVAFSMGGKRKIFTLSRLVAQAFVANPLNKPFVNHIDFDRSNNHYTNLEWVDHQENVKYSVDAGRFHALKPTNQTGCYVIDGVKYASSKEAEWKTGIKSGLVRHRCKSKNFPNYSFEPK